MAVRETANPGQFYRLTGGFVGPVGLEPTTQGLLLLGF